jgi:adenine-specific DNA-methyltransferase
MPTLEFKGKPFVYSHHLSVPFRELIVDPKKSLPAMGQKPSLDDNLIIHGDNLEALKALLPRYAGKIDVIYIDPPYNTGSEDWAYNDNVNSPLMKEWLGKVVDRDDMERHDKWLCMMWPRLQLLKELLARSGVIFASIDDNELCDLRCVMDEIFGDANWVGTIVWKNVTDNNPTNISIEHEYIVCYAGERARIKKEWKSPISDVKQVLVDIGVQLNKKYRGPTKQKI